MTLRIAPRTTPVARLRALAASARGAVLLAGAAAAAVCTAHAAGAQSRVADGEIASAQFAHNKVGVSPVRRLTVYLPDGYDADARSPDTQSPETRSPGARRPGARPAGARRYPVVYYLHNFFDDQRTLYTRDGAQALFDRAIREGVVPGVIVVAADFGTPMGASWYTDSPVTGNWETFLVRELVPYVDAHYRTLPAAASRGLLGDRMGGYGALRVGMRHPDIFGAVYALHPVGTGTGVQPMPARPDWALLAGARTADTVLRGDIYSRIFTTIYQAHLPDPARPPLYVDLPARRAPDGRLVIDPAATERLQRSFLLERMVPEYAANLRRLRGLKFDWGRSDANQDHVYANQALTHKLDEFGVPHEAEEYRGGWGDRHWGEAGRVYSAALPFFRAHLAFGAGTPDAGATDRATPAR